MTEEMWKDIEGYEGLYQVSNLGNVRSLDRIVEMKHYSGCNATHKFKGKKISIKKQRYAQVGLWKNNVMETKTVHRLVANAFLDYNDYKKTDYDKETIYSKDELVINHKDKNKLNNNVDNLEWCTSSYNNRY